MSKCTEYVMGGVCSWPCVVEGDGHDGPHAATENRSSMLAREKWEAEQQQKEAPVQVASDISQLTPAVMENTVPLNVKALLDPATREQSMVAQLTSIEGMPQIFRELIMGQFSQVSLAAFYHLAQAEFAKGATAVAVTPEFLNNMLTPSLRQRFEALARAEREG